MSADEWITVLEAIGMLERTALVEYIVAPDYALELRRSLECGQIRSRGIPAVDGVEPEPIPAARWTELQFTRDGRWLYLKNDPRLAAVYTEVRIARKDFDTLVSRLAPPV